MSFVFLYGNIRDGFWPPVGFPASKLAGDREKKKISPPTKGISSFGLSLPGGHMQGYKTTSAALKLKRNAFDVSRHRKMFSLSKKKKMSVGSQISKTCRCH